MCPYEYVFSGALVSLCILSDTLSWLSYSSMCVCIMVHIVHSSVSVHRHVQVCLCSSVCVRRYLSCRNSCSGVELITGWVFWGELPAVQPSAPPPPPSFALCCITGLSPNDRVLLSSPLKSLSHSFPTRSPTTKEPSCLWSRLGKSIDKTLVGKDLGLCQVVHAVDHQKNHIFV